MRYIKQLDSVRAIAVTLVVLSHWIPKINIWMWGEVGVDIFFVLSGFLITTILLESDRQYSIEGKSKFLVIKNFVIRRALRIFPLYYMVVFAHFIIDDSAGPTIRETIEYHIFYVSNIYFSNNPDFTSLFTHFWSLSVEEQFYLFWPWLIIFYKKHRLPVLIFGIILLSTIYSLTFPGRIDKLTPACLGIFSVGALLAYIRVEEVVLSEIQMKLMNYLFFLGLLLFLLFPLYKDFSNSHSVTRLLTAILTFRVIYYILYEGNYKAFNWILALRPLVFVGKISYGVYLIHTLGPWIWRSSIAALKVHGVNYYSLYTYIPKVVHNDLDLILKYLLVITLAWVSWFLFESPIMRLKKYFA